MLVFFEEDWGASSNAGLDPIFTINAFAFPMPIEVKKKLQQKKVYDWSMSANCFVRWDPYGASTFG